MAKCLFKNNVSTVLAQPVYPGDTLILLAPGTGNRFPSIGSGNWYYVTIFDRVTGGLEVMRVTARLDDALTVERGIDATVPRAFAATDVIEMRLVASAMNDIYFANYGDAPFGVPILDEDGKIKPAQLPGTVITETNGDLRYILKTTRGVANGVATLDVDTKLPAAQLPAAAMLASARGAASGVASLDENSKIPVAQMPESYESVAHAAATFETLAGAADKYLPKANPSSTGTFAHAGVITVQAGAARGKLTVSTAAPSGAGAEGDEWYQVEA